LLLKNHANTLQIYYEVLKHNQMNIADVTYIETINNLNFMDILKKANKAKEDKDLIKLENLRKESFNLLKDNYQLLRKKGILQYHFVFPDNVSFLRMHKPSKYGDNLSKIRTDFNYSNTTLNNIRGFSQGRTSHAFRNVYPIINKQNEHLGSIEVSFSSELLQNYFTKINKLHTHFLVRKDIFKSHAWKRDDLILKYQQSAEHPNYMITMTDQHSKETCIIKNSELLFPQRDKIKNLMDKKEKFSIYNLTQKQTRVISFYPIKHNYTQEVVAWIVSYENDMLIDKVLQNDKFIKFAIFIVLFLLFSFIYYIINQKNILHELVEQRTASLQKINRELEESEQELEILNEKLEHKIEEEVSKNRQKDQLLFEQTKMAALGEMIANIAHQWRQPLSVISTGVTGMLMQKEFGSLCDDDFKKNCNIINENVQYLSHTIDDFKNFIQGNNKKETFNLKKAVQSSLNLVSSSIKRYNITVLVNIEENISINGLPNELKQCFINLFNNSKDALMETDSKKLIIIDSFLQNNKLIIEFKDNAGGIDENIITKIFEPYFTTKHKSQGTGLGLNMTYRLIVEGMGGSISVSNNSFKYEDETYTGALFIISIPI